MKVVTSPKNNSGFTLVEVAVAILIMMVGMLGLLEAINVATEHNLKNQMRDEAVSVGEKYMAMQRGKIEVGQQPFAKYSTDTLANGHTYSTRYEPSRIRGTGKSYSVDMDVAVLTSDTVTSSRQLTVTVSWTYKGVTYQNRVTAPVSAVTN